MICKESASSFLPSEPLNEHRHLLKVKACLTIYVALKNKQTNKNFD